MSLVILLSATLLHRQIHQCLICAIHQFLIHAKCCSSVPSLALSQSFKNTATYTRTARLPNKYDPSPIAPADLMGEKKQEVWGSMEDSHWRKGKSEKKGEKQKKGQSTQNRLHTRPFDYTV